jgi:hypothetical protein
MSRTEVLRTVTKEADGVAALCKTIAASGDSIGVTEAELTKLIDDEAQKTRKAGERPDSVFSRYLQAPDNVDLRKALQIAKARPPMETEPRVVGGTDIDVNDPAAALQQLEVLAEEAFRRGKWESKASALLAVFEAPENRWLAERAHVRPAPTTSYEFPR